jgi:hypothetical protein
MLQAWVQRCTEAEHPLPEIPAFAGMTSSAFGALVSPPGNTHSI